MKYPLAILLSALFCLPVAAQERVAGPPAPLALHGGVELMSSGPKCAPCTDLELKGFKEPVDSSFAARKPAVRHKRQVRNTVKRRHVTQAKKPVRIATAPAITPKRKPKPEAPKLVARATKTNDNSREQFIKTAMCRAKNYIQCNQWECAARRLREVLYLQPTNQEARQLLSGVYEAAGVDPTSPAHRQQIAHCLASNGRQEAAIVEYREAARLLNTPGTHVGLAKAALKTDQKGLALQAFQSVVRLDPFDQSAWENIGFLQEGRGRLQDAAAAFLEAARLNPRNPVAVEKALQLAQRLAAQFPQNADRRLDLARAYLLSDRLPLAQQQYAQVARTVANAPSFDEWITVERENISLKQEGYAHRSVGHQLASNDVVRFLNEGPQPNGGDDVTDAAAKLKRGCNCD